MAVELLQRILELDDFDNIEICQSCDAHVVIFINEVIRSINMRSEILLDEAIEEFNMHEVVTEHMIDLLDGIIYKYL